jgi:nucleotide-binding universal stress UspA family protein
MATDKVVVGVDGSPGSAVALAWAAEEADIRGWRLEAVLTWDMLDQHHVDGVRRFDPDYDERSALAALQHHLGEVLGERAVTVERRVVLDRPAQGLLDAGRGAALLVVGARGLGGFKGLLLGSVSQHVLHHATGPVAVVHESSPESDPTRIVVGVDGSPNGAAALRWATLQAAATGARLDLVHAWHPPYVGGEPFVFSPVTYDDCRTGAQLTLDGAVATVDRSALATAPQPVLVDGAAAHALVDASAGASMVVVGARGLGGFAGLLLGSVSTQVTRHAHCPVVVVPADGPG